MPNTSLRSALDSLAANFASAVLNAIRVASIDELVAGSEGAPRRGPERPRGSSKTKAVPTAARGSAPAAKKGKGGRLARRSPAEIAKTLGTIVTLLKGKKAGLRSEEIRKVLKLDVREVPRVLKEGLAKKAIKSKGQKRATVYTAA
jgi:hypothetical protein